MSGKLVFGFDNTGGTHAREGKSEPHRRDVSSMDGKVRNLLDRVLDLIDRNQPRAFELARCALVARAPEEILMVEPKPGIVPTTVAGMIIDHSVRRFELVGRVRETGNHHDRRAAGPGEPGKSAGKADKKRGMLEQAETLGQRFVAGVVFRAV